MLIDRKLLLAGQRTQFQLQAADRLDHLVGLFDGLKQNILAHFFGPAFDHSDAFFGAGHDDIEKIRLHVLKGGIDDEILTIIADAPRAYRSRKGDVGYSHRRGGGDHGQYIRRV